MDCFYDISECVYGFTEDEYCHICPGNPGWGCRQLVTVPAESVSSDAERAALFSRVYREAKAKGVLVCPFFDESKLDEIVEDGDRLNAIREHYSGASSKC